MYFHVVTLFTRGVMKTKENNIVRISNGNRPDPVEIIRQLNETLNAVDMQEATIRAKASKEFDNPEFQDYFFGMGYIFTTIINMDETVKQYFLDTAKIVVGFVDNKECCWVSFCGWYILADGMYLIKMTKINYSDFEAMQEVAANLYYSKYYEENEPATKKDFRHKMS